MLRVYDYACGDVGGWVSAWATNTVEAKQLTAQREPTPIPEPIKSPTPEIVIANPSTPIMPTKPKKRMKV